MLYDFNPRPREEGDPIQDPAMINICISIHALVKRATIICITINVAGNHFNPRPREEGDYHKDE